MKIPFSVNLSGKTAIVTGGSGTLCSAMAYGLAVSGAKVALIGRNKEKMSKVVSELTDNALKEHNATITINGYCCNVTDKEELTKIYEVIKADLGSCDILINGAGGNQPGAITSTEMLKKEEGADDYSFWNLDETKIREVMDLNFMGTLLPIQVFTLRYGEKKKRKHYKHCLCIFNTSFNKGRYIQQCQMCYLKSHTMACHTFRRKRYKM